MLATILFLLVGTGLLVWGYAWLARQGKVPISLLAPAVFFLYSGSQLTIVAKQGLTAMTLFCTFLGIISLTWLSIAVKVTRKAQLDYLESRRFESELDQLASRERASGSLEQPPKDPNPAQVTAPPPVPPAVVAAPAPAAPVAKQPRPKPTPPLEPSPPPVTEPEFIPAPMTEEEPGFTPPPVTEPEPEPEPAPTRVLELDIALTPEMFNRDVDVSNATISVSIPEIAKRLKNPKTRKRTDPAAGEARAPRTDLFDPQNGVMLIQSTPGPKNLELIGDLLAPEVGMSAEDTASRLQAYKGPVILNNFNSEIAQALAGALEKRGIQTISVPVAQTLTPSDLGQITTLELKDSTVVLSTAKSRFEVQWIALYFLEVGVYGQEHDSEKEELVKTSDGTLGCELFLRQSGKALRFSLLAHELDYSHLGDARTEQLTDNLMLTLKRLVEKSPTLKTGPGYEVMVNQGLALAYPCLKSFSEQARGQFQLANARELQT